MKKALAIILVAVICVGLLPVSIFSAEVMPEDCTEAASEAVRYDTSEKTSSAESDDAGGSFSAEDAYQDIVYRLTHFSLDTLSDFIFWLVVAIIAIVLIVVIIIVILVIAVILFIIFGVILEFVLVPALTAIAGPLGTIAGILGGILGAIGGALATIVAAIVAFLKCVLPYLPEITEMIEKLT